MIRFLLIGVAVILSAGCANNKINDVKLSRDIAPINLPLSLMNDGEDYNLSQFLTVDYAGNIYRAVVEVERRDGKTVFVGMDPLGQVVFSIVIEGDKTEFNGEMNGIKPQVIVNDYLLTFTSLDVLENHLAKQGYRMTERADGLHRTLFFDELVVETISYSIMDKYRSTIQLVNNIVGYRINIKNSEQNITDDR